MMRYRKQLEIKESKKEDKTKLALEQGEVLPQEIRNIIKKNITGNIGELGDEDEIKKKLDIDSLQLVKIIIDIERKYQCDLSKIFICEKIITIKVLEEYILRKAYEKNDI